jgi:Fe-S-cluster containining protein
MSRQGLLLDSMETSARYECDGCGACCRTFPIFVAESDAEREPRIEAEGRRLPPWLATPRWKYQLYPLPFHETCCFLNGENRCTIYATRPDMCRAFAAGSSQCQVARAERGLGRLEANDTLVPLGQGSVVPSPPFSDPT